MDGAGVADADGSAPHGQRVGILGGTFDPVHIGHLVAATWVRDALSLDRVLLVVANEPWQKTAHRQVTPAEDRLAVVAAAVEGVPGLEPCRLEIDRGDRATRSTPSASSVVSTFTRAFTWSSGPMWRPSSPPGMT